MVDTPIASPASAHPAPSPWGHRFATLGPAFYTELQPTPLPDARWVAHSLPLAHELGIDTQWLQGDEALQVLTGNARLPGMRPLASVYSGHQFGVWAGQLGDGRAISLGELHTPAGWQELQLKGAGRTPYSRMGDGRAVLRSSIREFLCSEAMHALGVPTTRALCVSESPSPVRRETVGTAAVVTRVAPSFIRFGHFEHFSTRGQTDELRALADFVIEHFYPHCREADGNPYAALLADVTQRTAALLAQWQAVGFCHGVMNTDNMSVLGLTIDYGPFQFLDTFDPEHICNHSDHSGRYAYHRQPNIAYWNLFCLGQALMPLLAHQDEALAALEPYRDQFPLALRSRMNAKLGLHGTEPNDHHLTETVLQLMATDRVDYPIFWRRLSHAVAAWAGPEAEPDAASTLRPLLALFAQTDAFVAWARDWRARLRRDPAFGAAASQATMLASNPHVVLRNHLGQQAIAGAEAGDLTFMHRLQAALQQPFTDTPGNQDLADFPPDWAADIAISCSS